MPTLFSLSLLAIWASVLYFTILLDAAPLSTKNPTANAGLAKKVTFPENHHHSSIETLSTTSQLDKRQCNEGQSRPKDHIPPGYESKEITNASRWNKRQCPGNSPSGSGVPPGYESVENKDSIRWNKRQSPEGVKGGYPGTNAASWSVRRERCLNDYERFVKEITVATRTTCDQLREQVKSQGGTVDGVYNEGSRDRMPVA